mgnify:CR=1 FL=1
MDSIITNIELLNRPCRAVGSLEEGRAIGKRLLKRLEEGDDGIGLAANQIGIDARVCAIIVREPLILINPIIQSLYDGIVTVESCLSFPEQSVRTKRFKYVSIATDNIGSGVFGPNNDNDKLALLESICVQHEIGHLDGKTMFDFECKLEPRTVTNKFKRNDFVVISNGEEIRKLKWKKAQALVKNEGWNIISTI